MMFMSHFQNQPQFHFHAQVLQSKEHQKEGHGHIETSQAILNQEKLSFGEVGPHHELQDVKVDQQPAVAVANDTDPSLEKAEEMV